MKVSKRIVALVLCLCLFCSMGQALAVNVIKSGEARAVIGANLTQEQIESIYAMFGVERGSVTELTVTNAEEREYLEGLVDESLIGTNSISCVYIEILPEGEGLEIATENLTWCTKEMFVNALVTAGIDDARIIVAAPFPVSGTAALTGIYKAYEDITGEKIDEAAKLMGTQELVITAELADQIGSIDAVDIVNELKLILDETQNMTDEELREQILEIADEYDVTLVDSQIEQLITLCRSLEKLDPQQLKEKVEFVQQTAKKLAEAHEKVSVITETLRAIVDKISQIISSIVAFFKGEK
ncbi:MAG: DUF1002 domain-containing protein [Oscillospiraceae bacterium]